MDEVLLDTDILSEILKGKDPRVVEAGDRYLDEHGRFTFSAITFYEIFRGFRAKRAVRALNKFLKLAEESDVLPVSIPVLKRAADLWVDARQGGYPRDDADLIIAATALQTRRALATGNVPHFAWIEGLSLADWRSSTP
jgi:tRNA(fMet)-specific endonuclease VapC